MKHLILALALAVAPIAALPCSNTFQYVDGIKVVCTTCCDANGRCQTSCN